MYRVTGAFPSFTISVFQRTFLSFDTAKLGTKKQRRKKFSVAAQFVRVCLILNKVDTKSLKMYGETTPRKSLCEGL